MGTIESRTAQVADALLERNMENEDWEKGTAINGLLTTGREKDQQEAKRLVDRSIRTQTDDGKFSYDDPKPWMHGSDPHRAQCEPVTLGHGVLEFYDRTGDDRYLDAAEKQYEYLVTSAQRTADGGISYTTGPIELWVDSIYMLCPFFARYGHITGEKHAFEEAIKHITVQAKHLQDAHTGLFRHEWRENPNTYPESSFWARGNGWVTAGIVETLSYLPDSHEGRNDVLNILREQASSLLELQEENGLWHHILKYRDSPLETSATLQFAYSFDLAVELGILDETYRAAAQTAFEVAGGTVDSDGNVRRVAVPPGGPDAPLGTTSYGQGWYLLTANQINGE